MLNPARIQYKRQVRGPAAAYLRDPAVLTQRSLLFHTPCSEQGGKIIRDVVGFRPTVVGTHAAADPWVADPERGRVLNFVSSTNSQRVDFGFNEPQTLNVIGGTTQSWTLTCWIRMGATVGSSFPAIAAKHDAANGNAAIGWGLNVNTTAGADFGKVYFELIDGTRSLAAQTLTTMHNDKWHFIAAVCDRAAQLMKISADLAAFQTTSISALTSTVTNGHLYYGYRIDGSLNNNYWNGKLDDLRIFKAALSLDELTNLYRAPKPRLDLRASLRAAGGSVAGSTAKQGAVTIING